MQLLKKEPEKWLTLLELLKVIARIKELRTLRKSDNINMFIDQPGYMEHKENLEIKRKYYD